MLNTDYLSKEEREILLKENQKPFFCEKILNVQLYENAVVCPGLKGGVYAHHQWILESILQWDTKPIIYDNHFQPTHQELQNETVVYVGNFLSVWGHEITDSLSKFWFYFNEKYHYLKQLKFVYTLLWENSDCSQSFYNLIQLLGIPKENLIKITKPTQFKQVYIPDSSFFFDFNFNIRRFTPDYLNILNNIPPLPPIEKAPKVYFSRLCYSRSIKNFNEESLETFFQNQGFKIIYPEKCTLLEELAYLQNAQFFAATEGSIAHNFLFCAPSTTGLFLKKYNQITSYQLTINAMKQAQIIYINASYSPLANRNLYSGTQGPFFLYPTPQLCRFFNAPIQTFPLFLFLKSLYVVFQNYGLKKSYILINQIYIHPVRAKLKIKTRLKNLKKRLFKKSTVDS